MQNLMILAQATGGESQSEVAAEPVAAQGEAITVVDANASAKQAPARTVPPYTQWLFIAVVVVMTYFIIFREPRKRQRQQQKMAQSLKKNDKVRTIGGIIGTVVDIKGDEVVLKVDESNNTKIRVIASAIGKNLSSEGE